MSEKKKSLKVIICILVITLSVGILCSCAPMYSRVGELIQSAAEVKDRVAQEVTEHSDEWRNEIHLGNTQSAIAEAAESAMNGWMDEESWLEKYGAYGLSYDDQTGTWWYDGKPLAALYDESDSIWTNGFYSEIGVLLIAERDANGNIAALTPVTAQEFEQISGVAGMDESGEQRAEELGLAFYKQDRNVKGLDKKGFVALENELKAKYRNEDAVVQLNDYVFLFDKDEELRLSAFCSSGANRYGVKVSADCAIADEMDITQLDEEKTEKIIFDVLNARQQKNEREVKDEIAKAVAGAYGISEKYIQVDVAEMD